MKKKQKQPLVFLFFRQQNLAFCCIKIEKISEKHEKISEKQQKA